MRSIFVLFLIMIIIQCSNPKKLLFQKEATIPVENERVFLAPLINSANLDQLPGWPSDLRQQRIVLQNCNEIWTKLNAEFQRCQKYGLYEMVDDTKMPTVRISITLLNYSFDNDTLRMPVRLQAERLPDGQRYIYTIQALGYYSPSQSKKRSLSNANPGLLLASYKQHFPYKSIVSFFYPHLDSNYGY